MSSKLFSSSMIYLKMKGLVESLTHLR